MATKNLTPLKQLNELEQAIYFHARERRRSLAGIVELFRTHFIFGGTVMEVATIDTSVLFPVRSSPTTFKSAIRVTDTGSVATEHRGLVFELAGPTTGIAMWVGDQTIGIAAGGADAGGDGVSAIFDYGSELPPGLELELVFAVNPGNGKVRLWGNGQELVRGTATNGTFPLWAGANDGSFADDPGGGNNHPDVPAVSEQAPDGFEVIEPLSVYIGSTPRHFEA